MIPREVIERLRGLGYDVVSSRELGLDDFLDDVQLLAAAQTGRVLLTHDIKGFEKLHDAWRRWSAAWSVAAVHAGILIVPQGWPFGRVADEVDRFIRAGVDLPNQLYRWRAATGWELRPLREAPLPPASSNA